MGINIKVYVVRGYEIKENFVDSLKDEDIDYLMNMDKHFIVKCPMISSEGVFGETLFVSNDGRYGDIEFDFCVEDLKPKKTDSEMFRSLPKYLKDHVVNNDVDIKTHFFMCYS